VSRQLKELNILAAAAFRFRAKEKQRYKQKRDWNRKAKAETGACDRRPYGLQMQEPVYVPIW